MSDDLREVVSALKTAGVIGRIGDYAKKIAKRVAIFAEAHPVAPLTIVTEMARGVSPMVKSALDSFVARATSGERRVGKEGCRSCCCRSATVSYNKQILKDKKI